MIEPSVGVCFLSGDEVHEMTTTPSPGPWVETGKASRVSELAMVLLRLPDCSTTVRIAHRDTSDDQVFAYCSGCVAKLVAYAFQ